MRLVKLAAGAIIAVPLVLVLIAVATGQGGGVYIGTAANPCTAITSPTTSTICYDVPTVTWKAWTGAAYTTVGGTSDGASGRVQLSTGAGLFTSDALLTFSTTNKLLTTSGLAVNLVAKTGNYSATRADQFITVDATSAPVTITLPTAVTQKGLLIYIKKIDASANVVTVARSGSDTIDGDTTATMNARWTASGFVSDGGTQWLIY